MERAGYPPISPDISHEDQEPIIRNREVVNVAFNPPFDSIFTGSIPIDAGTRPSGYWTDPIFEVADSPVASEPNRD